jgi:hypothetical protein
MRAALDLRVGEHRLQGFQVAVNVAEEGYAHGRSKAKIRRAAAPWQCRFRPAQFEKRPGPARRKEIGAVAPAVVRRG